MASTQRVARGTHIGARLPLVASLLRVLVFGPPTGPRCGSRGWRHRNAFTLVGLHAQTALPVLLP